MGWTPIEVGGDFRSKECFVLLKQSVIVVANPPYCQELYYLDLIK